MSSIVIAIDRPEDSCKGYEDRVVKEISQVLEDLGYKKLDEIDERSEPSYIMNDRRLRFRPKMIGEQL